MRNRLLPYALLVVVLAAACSESDQGTMTESGYEYVLLHDAPGPTAQPGEYVFVWTNFLVSADSSLFNTRETDPEPAAVPIPETSDGPRSNLTAVQDVLRFASIGDSIRLIFPVDSFDSRPPALQDAQFVWYDMTVVDIKTADAYLDYVQEKQEEQAAASKALQEQATEVAGLLADRYAAYQNGSLEKDIQRTPSGLGYIILEEGTANSKPDQGQQISAHYYGIFASNGEMFDNSFRRGRTFDFNVGEGGVIGGWDEGFALLNKGAEAILFVPPSLGYGDADYGSIPGGSELIFYVQRMQ
ncbi:MAG: FKBP-type peptidyl-prolyl cis-trans isomerase [Saprospiraceae bacterium]|nr:FKBP-type peptidyl-prolyl cis-trans isomerase [Saprospiraceae bacterium]